MWAAPSRGLRSQTEDKEDVTWVPTFLLSASWMPCDQLPPASVMVTSGPRWAVPLN